MGKKIFGTDGVRGRVGTLPITVESMLQLGCAFGRVLRRSSKTPFVIIGRDTRISGSALLSALQAGLASTGVAVQSVGVISTPAIAYLTVVKSACAGIVISASHNPYYDNGVKFFDDKGMKLSNDLEAEIEKEWSSTVLSHGQNDFGLVSYCWNSLDVYVQHCISTILDGVSFSDMNLVIDMANGATFSAGPAIFSQLGCNATYINYEPDGLNINDHCGATDVKELQRQVLINKADCGIAFDGDGDRLIMVDHRGELVDGDQILCILAFAIKLGELPGVVGTLMTNLGLEQALNTASIPFVRANVGDKYVLADCQQRGWFLGGESSGHIIDLRKGTTGDGIVAALQVLSAMVAADSSLYDLKQQMTKHPQVLLNVAVSSLLNLDDYPSLLLDINAVQQRLADRGRVLVRPSGTEPCVRVMVEGSDANEVQLAAVEIKSLVADAVAAGDRN